MGTVLYTIAVLQISPNSLLLFNACNKLEKNSSLKHLVYLSHNFVSQGIYFFITVQLPETKGHKTTAFIIIKFFWVRRLGIKQRGSLLRDAEGSFQTIRRALSLHDAIRESYETYYNHRRNYPVIFV